MNPVEFEQANTVFGPPAGLEESQCQRVNAFVHEVIGGSCDGCAQVVVAWMPTAEERELIKAGGPIFLSVIGGLPPHYLSTTFEDATHPA